MYIIIHFKFILFSFAPVLCSRKSSKGMASHIIVFPIGHPKTNFTGQIHYDDNHTIWLCKVTFIESDDQNTYKGTEKECDPEDIKNHVERIFLGKK